MPKFIFIPTMELQQLQQMATQVRRDIVRMVHGVQSGHPGGSLGFPIFLNDSFSFITFFS
jgi:transketolase N-terminal domain/subunit